MATNQGAASLAARQARSGAKAVLVGLALLAVSAVA
jgi:hypothetical protein